MKKFNRKIIIAMLSGGLILTSIGATAASADLENTKIGFLMPDHNSTRYENHDLPGFKAALADLCSTCKVLYQNANASASTQQEQFESVISQGAKAIVIDPVDSSTAGALVQQAHRKGVKVISYDRPITSAQADFYTSFDNEGLGKMIAESLVKHLQEQGISPDDGGVLEVNGSPVDAAAGLIKKGIHAGLATGDYATLNEYDTPGWDPSKAQQWVSSQTARFGKKIIGVAAANDGTAGGAISALKAAGFNPVPPVSGNDATIAGLQRIIAGTQYNTINKPSETLAAGAAKAAVKLISGETPEATTTLFDTPSKLFTPQIITADNLKAEIIDKKVNGKPIETVESLCTKNYVKHCKKLGLME